jgi:hypothetical protein
MVKGVVVDNIMQQVACHVNARGEWSLKISSSTTSHSFRHPGENRGPASVPGFRRSPEGRSTCQNSSRLRPDSMPLSFLRVAGRSAVVHILISWYPIAGIPDERQSRQRQEKSQSEILSKAHVLGYPSAGRADQNSRDDE